MTTAGTANIAILGCGRQGRVHANAILTVGGVARLHSVYDAFEAASIGLSQAHPHQPKIASSVKEILADPAVDAVIIVTPNATHADLALKAAKAGKAVLCEKPLDRDLESIQVLRVELAKLAEKGPLPYMSVGFVKRHDGTFSSIRQAIQKKMLGEVEQVIIWSRDVTPQPKEYMKVSGTMIVDSAIHEFDLARSLLGPDDYPVSIYTVGSTLVLPEACAEAEDVTRTNITMKTKLGRLVCFQNARRAAAGHDQRVEVHCELGDLKAENPHAQENYLVVSTASSGAATQPMWTTTAERYTVALLNQMRELVAACVGGRGPLPEGQQVGATIEDGWWASKAAAAAVQSLRDGVPVQLSLE